MKWQQVSAEIAIMNANMAANNIDNFVINDVKYDFTKERYKMIA